MMVVAIVHRRCSLPSIIQTTAPQMKWCQVVNAGGFADVQQHGGLQQPLPSEFLDSCGLDAVSWIKIQYPHLNSLFTAAGP